jgi:hypothetical protein
MEYTPDPKKETHQIISGLYKPLPAPQRAGNFQQGAKNENRYRGTLLLDFQRVCH